MNVDHARQIRQGVQGNRAQTTPQCQQGTCHTRKCFNYYQKRHFTRQCPHPHQTKITETSTEDFLGTNDRTLVDYTPNPPDIVANTIHTFQSMTDKQRQRMEQELEVSQGQDFQTI